MKKIVLASVLVAGVLFAADFSSSTPEQINASIADADAKSLSEAAFEIDKRAGELRAQARDLKRGFKAEFKRKLDAMSVEDREKFLDEFRKNYNAQAGKLAGTGPIGPGVDQHGTGAVTDQDGVSLPHVEHV